MVIFGKESTRPIAFSAIDKLNGLFQNLEKTEKKKLFNVSRSAFRGALCHALPLTMPFSKKNKINGAK